MQRPSGRRIELAIAGLAVALGFSSCNHEAVTSGTAGLSVQFVPSPAGSGRYERGTMDLAKDGGIQFLPEDPERAALFPNPLTIGRQFSVDLTSSASTAIATTALSPGTYVVTFLRVTPPTLGDDNPPTPPASCIENFPFLPTGPAVGDIPPDFTFDASDGLRFTVRSGQTKLQLRVDVPALITGYENAFDCEPSCNGGGPCLASFDPVAFRASLLQAISFE